MCRAALEVGDLDNDEDNRANRGYRRENDEQNFLPTVQPFLRILGSRADLLFGVGDTERTEGVVLLTEVASRTNSKFVVRKAGAFLRSAQPKEPKGDQPRHPRAPRVWECEFVHSASRNSDVHARHRAFAVGPKAGSHDSDSTAPRLRTLIDDGEANGGHGPSRELIPGDGGRHGDKEPLVFEHLSSDGHRPGLTAASPSPDFERAPVDEGYLPMAEQFLRSRVVKYGGQASGCAADNRPTNGRVPATMTGRRIGRCT